MKSFAIDGNNDFLVSGRSLSLLSGVDAVLAVCAHAAKAILGEMVFSQTQGMPYFETVWIGAPTTAPFEAAFRDRIRQVEGVTEIQELTVSLADGKMTYSATIATIYGTGTLNG